MERRMLLAVALSFAVIVLYSAATGQCSPRPPQGDGENTAPVTPGPDPANPAATPDPRNPSDQPAPAAVVPTGQWPDAVRDDSVPQPAPASFVVTDDAMEFEAGFTNEGGALRFVRLKHEFEPDKTTPLDIVVPTSPTMLTGQIDRTWLKPMDGSPGSGSRREDPAGLLRTAIWERDLEAEQITQDVHDIVFVLETEQAIWRKRWILPNGSQRYDVRLRVSREAKDTKNAGAVRIKVLAATGLLREPDTGAAFQEPNSVILRTAAMSDATSSPTGIEIFEGADVGSLRVLGARSHFFMTSYFMDKDWAGAPNIVRCWATGHEGADAANIENRIARYFREERGRSPDADPALLKRIKDGVKGIQHAWIVLDLPSGTDAISAEGTAVEIPFYMGPVSRLVFRQEVYAPIKPIIDYRMAFDLIADGLLGIYDFFRNLFSSVGIGVILMTLVVRGLMMPLSIKNQLSMRGYSQKIAKLKPKLDILKKKYATNPKKIRDEQGKLYREHGVGFPTGCLMMFVQIPIFFALFSSLRMEFSLRNADFLWIADMAAPDKLVDFGKTLFDIGILKVFSLNILPLIMVGLSLWQQRLMPKPADEQQAQQMRMMKWLPIFFAVILYNYSAALAIYMCISSSVSIVEGRIVRRMDPNPNAPGATPIPTM